MDATPLVERDSELEAIEELLAAARMGAGGALLIDGPAGIGKSSLLGAARATAGELRVLSARGSELEREFPLGIARQLLEPVLAGTTDEERSALFAGAGALAARVLGQPDAATRDIAEAQAAFHGLYWFTANLASRQPVLLLVDDAQWADLTSLRWLAYLTARIEGVPLACLVTVRRGEASAGEHVLDEIASDPAVRTLHPEGLSEAAVAALVEQRLGAPPEAAFVDACRTATRGNPFLLGELLGELRRAGASPTAENATQVDEVNPRSVARSLRTRLRRLPPECRALARAVSVIGDEAPLETAAALAGLERAVASAAADSLSSSELLEARRPLAFVHPLVRASVYAELSAGEQAEWHARAAELLAVEGAPPERLAVHLLASEPRGDEETVRRLRDAAAGARQRGATDASIAYLRRALREPALPESEAELVLELGSAELQAVDIGPAIEHLRQATRGLRGRSRAFAAAELGAALAFTNRPEEGVSALNDAIAGLSEEERELGLLLQVARSMVGPVSLDAWRLLEKSGLRFDSPAEHPGTPGERLHVAELALQAALTSTAERARELATTALAGGGLLADPGPFPLLVFKAPIALNFADALEEATLVFGELLELAQGRGSEMTFVQASHMRSSVWWRRGALAEAEADAENALRYPSPQLRLAPLTLVEIRLMQGDVAGAAEIWRSSGLQADHGGGRAEVAPLQTRARLRAAQGRAEDALADLLHCGRLEEAWQIRTPALSTWRSDAARLLVSLGRTEEAERLAREEVERCRAFGAPRQLAIALRAVALTAEQEAGLALLDEAVALLEHSHARLEHALTLFELGAARRRAGKRTAARETLTAALELARVCGATLVATRAHDELVTAGARPRRDPIESRSALTASELRVARMAATGMSNREIAQALFLTEKTIENHLRSCYRKLEIGSRSQLARALPAQPEAVVV